MSRSWTSEFFRVIPLYLVLATSLGFVDYRIRLSPERAFTEYIPGVVQGTEPPPGRYRVLGPWLYERFADVIPDRPIAWAIFRWLCLLATFLTAHVYLRTWFQTGGAVAGTSLLAAILPLTFNNGWGHPDHLIELPLLALAASGIARGWSVWKLALVVAVAALNRETSALIVLLYLCAGSWSRGRLAGAVVLGAVWLAVTGWLRVSLGWAGYDPWQLGNNWAYVSGRTLLLHSPYHTLYPWFFVVLVGAMAGLTVAAWRRQPRLVKASASVVVPAFVVVCVLFSSIIETRIFSPLLILLLPGVMSGWFEPKLG